MTETTEVTPLRKKDTKEVCMAAHISLKRGTFDEFTKSMGWTTQAQAAAGLGVAEITIWRIVNGKTPVGGPFIAALLDAAGPRKGKFHHFFEVTRAPSKAAA